MHNRIARPLMPLLIFAVFFAGMAIIQFSTPNLPDNDGFYHIRLAWLMRTEGLKPDFPYLPLSILNEREFYDHHFLYHVALIPFTFFGDLLTGAKWSAVTFASLAFLAVWYLLKRQNVPYAWLWAIGLLGISDAFLYRMSVTRAQSVSLGLLALAMIFLLERKHLYLGILSFLYVWFYDAFPLVLALAGLYVLAVALVERRLDLVPLYYALGGVALGVLVNPYFPYNLIFTWRHMLPKLTETTAVSVGNEWYPYNTTQLLENSLPSLLAFVSGALALGISGRRMEVRTAFGFLAAVLFGAMLFQARRFVEYFPAFALIFAAFAWSPLVLDLGLATVSPVSPLRTRSLRWLPGLLILLLGGYAVFFSIRETRASLEGAKPYDLYAEASAWLEQNTPAGTRLFQTDWDDFPRLFYYNTHNTYLVGLDPTYMQLYDPQLYDLWVQITDGDVENPSWVIYNDFAATYIHTDLRHGNFIRAAEADPALREVYRDDDAIIYQVLVEQLRK